jgi:Flp pilus assembly protein TadG
MSGSMSPSRGSGRKRGLTFGSGNADKRVMDSTRLPARARREGARDSRERGQALVEFALIAPLFLLIVVGIIQFGIGLNYWLDLNRIANQGARWAVVDHGWTNCPKTATTCNSPTLQQYLESQPVSGGLDPTAFICFPDGPTANSPGSPVQVRVESDFTFLPIMDLGTITLRGKATMRIEQPVTRYAADGTC